MGASISKSKSSRNSFMSLCDKTTKKTTFGPAGPTRVEPSLYAQLKKDEKQRKKSKKHQRHKKNNITKSIIGQPTDFIHLNHAGFDYTSMETLFMPIEQAQIIHIATSNTNYANDHSFLSARRQIEIKQQQKIQLSITANARQQENEVLSEKQNGHHDAGLFTDELHAILHDTKILSNSQIGLAY